MNKATASLEKMDYSEFVSFIGIDNTPPGGLASVKEWIKNAHINSNSRVLDLACNSGFTSMNLVRLANCTCTGIDINPFVIENAKKNIEKNKLDASRISFHHLDARQLWKLDTTFSHVVAGASFGFIQNRDKVISLVNRHLDAGGLLCVANFYFTQPPKEKLIATVSQTLGYPVNPGNNLEFWLQTYMKAFTCEHLGFEELAVYEKQDLQDHIYALVYEGNQTKHLTKAQKDYCFNRFYKTRLQLNELRKYQRYFVGVFRKR